MRRLLPLLLLLVASCGSTQDPRATCEAQLPFVQLAETRSGADLGRFGDLPDSDVTVCLVGADSSPGFQVYGIADGRPPVALWQQAERDRLVVPVRP